MAGIVKLSANRNFVDRVNGKFLKASDDGL
jgi:hypothetical protein